MSEKRLAIVISHPVQYYSPLFKLLTKHLQLKVFYCHNPTAEEQGRDGFKHTFKWDIDLFDGYEYEFLENVSKVPSVSSDSKNGCDNPQVKERLAAFGASHLVVFGWYLKAYKQALKAGKQLGIKIASKGDYQLDSRQSPIKRLIKYIYYPFFLNQFDCFLYNGNRSRLYLRNYRVPERKMIFSPYCVDQTFWKRNKPKSSNPFIFIWVGKFIGKKHPLELIKTFISIFQGDASVELVMVGSGDLLPEAENLSKNQNNIKLLGFKNQNELKELFDSANCLVLVSDYQETWGLVVNEGFSYHIPAIVSSACGCSADLINQNTGIIFPYQNYEALGTAMKKMRWDIVNKKQEERFEKGIEEVNQIYSYENVIKSFTTFVNL